MNSQVISVAEPRSHLFSNPISDSISGQHHRSNFHLSFNNIQLTNPNKQALFLKNSRSSSLRTRARASSSTNPVYSLAPTTGTFYDLLGVSEGGTLSEIKQSYKQLARKYHPDVSPPDRIEEYTKRFIRVRQAYEILSDPRTRTLYDTDLAGGLHLAFSSRKRSHFNQNCEERGEWKNRWEIQLNELNRKSSRNKKDEKSGEKMSWGARMRARTNPIDDGLMGLNKFV